MYFKDKRKIIFTVIIFIIIAIGVSFSIYDEVKDINNDENENTVQNNEQEGEYLTRIDLVLFNNDKTIKWNLDSEKLTQKDEGNIYNMSLLQFKAFENDNLIYTGEGQEAEYNNDEKVISLSGDISINKNAVLLETKKIIWEQKNDIIKGTDGVKLISDDLIITSEQFSGPISLNRIEFTGTESSQAKVEWR